MPRTIRRPREIHQTSETLYQACSNCFEKRDMLDLNRKGGSMTHRLEDLTGASLVATDGEIGKVLNFLFDDHSWRIRYLIVDVRHWLPRPDVVIAVSAIELPDWERRVFSTRLTKEQVRHSPNVDSTRPVSRQQEVAMSEHYGWPGYWDDCRDLDFPLLSSPVGREFPVHGNEDPHLRSAEAIIGYEVWTKDEEMGRLADFIVDDAPWHIGYLDVKRGDSPNNGSTLIPTPCVESVSWADHRVNVKQARSSVPTSSQAR
jgi:hypothetical protein